MSENVEWQYSQVSEGERTRAFGHRGAVIWLTGLPGSGKSTIAIALERELLDKKVHASILDGDNVRHGLNVNLGFSESDRKENIRRVGEVAKLFADAGQIVIAAFISPYADSRKHVRDRIGDKFIEVFVDCPLNICEKRDPKGHYKRARRGEIKQFTGVSAPYEIPSDAEIVVQTDKETLDQCVALIMNYLEKGRIISDAKRVKAKP